MGKNMYITFVSESVRDGGMARNRAFYKYFGDTDTYIHNIWHKTKIIRIFKMLLSWVIPFFIVNRNVFIHMGVLMDIFPKFLLRNKLGFGLFRIWFVMLSKRNNLLVEINDLPYEQSKDLGLKVENFYNYFQNVLFNRNAECNYIFASSRMRNYVVKKFKINPENTQVILNGAPRFVPDISITKDQQANNLKFVYAGTLNQGRGIEQLLKFFKTSTHQLLLVGAGGEWIKETENISYLGSLIEEEAMKLVSKCDLGIVHYDETKFYYNICFPTKFSFYIQCELPILSTNLEESTSQLDNLNIGYFKPFNEWSEIISKIDKQDVKLKKANVIRIKDQFIWDHLINDRSINFK